LAPPLVLRSGAKTIRGGALIKAKDKYRLKEGLPEDKKKDRRRHRQRQKTEERGARQEDRGAQTDKQQAEYAICKDICGRGL